MAMYPHNNLNRDQRRALDRLRAPRWRFRRYWATVTLTDPDGKGLHFFPRQRLTWALEIKGYRVIEIAGRVQEHHEPLPPWPPEPPRLRVWLERWQRAARKARG